jgi:predicted nucleic acid-binding protein
LAACAGASLGRASARNHGTRRVTRLPGFLDTNVILRYFTLDPSDQGAAARDLIDSADTLYITHAILAETGYVLTSVYKTPRAEVVDRLIELIHKQNITTWDGSRADTTAALLLCRNSNRVAFADALLWATARASRTPVVYTFDQRFPEDGIHVRRPGG